MFSPANPEQSRNRNECHEHHLSPEHNGPRRKQMEIQSAAKRQAQKHASDRTQRIGPLRGLLAATGPVNERGECQQKSPGQIPLPVKWRPRKKLCSHSKKENGIGSQTAGADANWPPLVRTI